MNDGHSNGSFDSRRASLIVALLSGAITLRNGSKTYENSLGIQDLKGAVDRDLERLRAKLSYGQIVSSTQWNAEFSSYQAIWKGMVAVRTLATKIVLREDELIELGLPSDYLAFLLSVSCGLPINISSYNQLNQPVS